MVYWIIGIVLIACLFWLSRTLKKSSAMLNDGIEYAAQHGKIPKKKLQALLSTDEFMQWSQEQVSHLSADEIKRVGQAQIFGQLFIDYYQLKNQTALDQDIASNSKLISVQRPNNQHSPTENPQHPAEEVITQTLDFFDVDAERDRILMILYRPSTALVEKEQAIDALEVLVLKYADMKSAEFLGEVYHMGKYVAEDREAAQLFYEIAAGQGSEMAKQRIQQLKSD